MKQKIKPTQFLTLKTFAKVIAVTTAFLLMLVVVMFSWGEYNHTYIEQVIQDFEQGNDIVINNSSSDDVLELLSQPYYNRLDCNTLYDGEYENVIQIVCKTPSFVQYRDLGNWFENLSLYAVSWAFNNIHFQFTDDILDGIDISTLYEINL